VHSAFASQKRAGGECREGDFRGLSAANLRAPSRPGPAKMLVLSALSGALLDGRFDIVWIWSAIRLDCLAIPGGYCLEYMAKLYGRDFQTIMASDDRSIDEKQKSH
jgi:hypothetical protein